MACAKTISASHRALDRVFLPWQILCMTEAKPESPQFEFRLSRQDARDTFYVFCGFAAFLLVPTVYVLANGAALIDIWPFLIGLAAMVGIGLAIWLRTKADRSVKLAIRENGLMSAAVSTHAIPWTVLKGIHFVRPKKGQPVMAIDVHEAFWSELGKKRGLRNWYNFKVWGGAFVVKVSGLEGEPVNIYEALKVHAPRPLQLTWLGKSR